MLESSLLLLAVVLITALLVIISLLLRHALKQQEKQLEELKLEYLEDIITLETQINQLQEQILHIQKLRNKRGK